MSTQTATITAPATTTITPHPAESSSTPYIPRGPVTASLNFYQPPTDDSPPFNYVESPPAGEPQRNFSDTAKDVLIRDLRSEDPSSFSLPKHAFAALQNVPSAAGREVFISDGGEVEKVYYPEIEDLLLKNVPGANRVLIFDHTIRLSTTATAKRAPVNRVHVDQTPKSGPERVWHHLPDEASELLKGRVRIINVWRPLNPPIAAHPLAFADSRSVPEEAMVGIQHRYPDRTGETAAVKWTEGQEWWYWSGMEEGERLLLQCFDSETGGRVPHSAFVDERSGEGVGRESVEVRALVFG
ncbi:MAG: hypothetical protein L6R41_004718 [Letrouitia leprolyta]|nr:MAG: hypothetical protein L6R41_004718 [Letrouitia leprolyta]